MVVHDTAPVQRLRFDGQEEALDHRIGLADVALGNEVGQLAVASVQEAAHRFVVEFTASVGDDLRMGGGVTLEGSSQA